MFFPRTGIETITLYFSFNFNKFALRENARNVLHAYLRGNAIDVEFYKIFYFYRVIILKQIPRFGKCVLSFLAIVSILHVFII